MYVQGDFTEYYTKPFCELLDQHPEVDGVFCANDEMAKGLYKAAKKRGLVVGQDISIFGYDDSIVAASSIPPMASVRADSWKMGADSLRIAVDLLNGKKVQNTRIRTNFINRDSIKKNNTLAENNFDKIRFESIFYRFIYEASAQQIQKIQKIYDRIYEVAQKIIERKSCTKEDVQILEKEFNDFFRSEAVRYADIESMIRLMDSIREYHLSSFDQESQRILMKLLFNINSNMSMTLNRQFRLLEDDCEYEWFQMKYFVKKLLEFDKGTDASYGMLMDRLAWVGIRNAALYIYDNPIIHLEKEEFVPPKRMLLKAILRNQKVEVLPPYQQSVNVDNIFLNEYYHVEERTDRIVLPLFDNELLFENERIQLQLEENLSILQQNNIKLDTLSKSDALTGIYNRRGFYEEAGKMLADLRRNGKSMLIMYVDMNNLKIINDRYGHNEGDEALKQIGVNLKAWVGDRGITGRIGGDEYSCVIEFESEVSEIVKCVDEINGYFLSYNEKSDKPYNLTVSIGGYLLKADEDLGLEAALQKADKMMYEEKIKRKKEVAKKMGQG